MEKSELVKSKPFISAEIIDYVPNSVEIKTILHKNTGSICIMAFDSNEGHQEKTNPFDVFVQIIEGKADIVIDGVSNSLLTGQSIVIPGNSSKFVKAHGPFKIIQTVIKSGYE